MVKLWLGFNVIALIHTWLTLNFVALIFALYALLELRVAI